MLPTITTNTVPRRYYDMRYSETQVRFSEAPPQPYREVLNAYGFRWNRRGQYWYAVSSVARATVCDCLHGHVTDLDTIAGLVGECESEPTYRVFDPEAHPFYSPALAEYPLIRDGIACCEIARQGLLRDKEAHPARYLALGGDEALRFAVDQLCYESERADWFGMDLSGAVFVEDDGRWQAVVLNRLGQVLEISPGFEDRDAAEDWAEECYGERVAS